MVFHICLQGTQYPCVMQKPQSFSSMFRHYAKHNGLDKTTLRFFFVEELEPDQTPETVALMPHDFIYVSHVVSPIPPVVEPHTCELSRCMGELLKQDINDLADVTFRVGPLQESVNAHKAILCARSSYFAAMFRPGGLAESVSSEVRISEHSVVTFKKVLEYIYTSHIHNINEESFEDLFDIICLSSEYMLTELQTLCEQTVINAMDTDNVCECFLFATKKFCSPVLQEYCQDFVVANIEKLRTDDKFRSAVAESPSLALLLVDYISGNHKKRKRSSAGSASVILSSGFGDDDDDHNYNDNVDEV
jgi:hypothetical protein